MRSDQDYFMLSKLVVGAGEDGSVNKAIAVQVWGAGFDPQEPKARCVPLGSPRLSSPNLKGGGQRQMPGAQSPAGNPASENKTQ